MLILGGHVPFETVDGTDFGGVVTRGQFRPVSESEVGDKREQRDRTSAWERYALGRFLDEARFLFQ